MPVPGTSADVATMKATAPDGGRSPRVTVVVVNFNGGDMVLDCLSALRRQGFDDFRTVVVDNASSDGSAQRIAADFPEVALLQSPRNLGFAGGVNHALRSMAPGEYVALLNPDAFPDPDWLEQLVAAARRHPEAAAFGSRMLRAGDAATLDGVGDAYHVSGMVWRVGYGSPAAERYANGGEIFSPCAAAALYRTAAVLAAGGMDEDFFCYVEDVDLGFRLRLAGHSCRYVPAAVVRHVGSAITGAHSAFQYYHGHRNVVWVFVKNMPGALFWLLLPLHLAMNLFVLVSLGLRGQGGPLLRAKRDALLGVRATWRKRRRIQASRRASSLAILRQLTWTPFRR